MLKPVVRTAIIELADIHLKYGFMNEALVMYRKAYTDSAAPLD